MKQALEYLKEVRRDERIRLIGEYIEDYYREMGDVPDAAVLEALADVILHEELSDTDPDKVTNNEYPFFSEWQLIHRGKRQVKDSSATKYAATDGKFYFKGRRPRPVSLPNDANVVDEATERRKKNKERRKRYNEATKPSEVIVYRIKTQKEDGE